MGSSTSDDHRTRWLDTAEVADRLDVSRATVRLWIRKGELPARRFGPKKYFVPAQALEMRLDDPNDAPAQETTAV